MKPPKALAIVLFFGITMLYAQNPLIHFPSLSPDATKLAFSYQGDIWVSDVNGKNPNRLTIHEGYDTKPIWSTNGAQIVFQSDRYGNNDVFVIASGGGMPKRLTFHSSADVVTDFTPSGQILFQSRRYFQQVEREPEVLVVSKTGGTPVRYMNSLGFDAVLSPDGSKIAFTRGSCRLEREAYRGPANRNIWVYHLKNNKYHQITTDEGNDFYPQWAGNNALYFQSARNGHYNVHKINITADGTKEGSFIQLTNFNEMGIFSFKASRNGNKIVAVQGDKLFVQNVTTGSLEEVKLALKSDYRFDPVVLKTYTYKADNITPSPDGNYSLLEIRGELFLKENGKDKKRTINLSQSPYRDRNAVWATNETVIFISDRDGQNDLYMLVSGDTNEKNLFKTLKHKIIRLTDSPQPENKPVISPDGSFIAFTRGRGQLIMASLDKGKITNEKILLNGWDTPEGVSWSPDSQWIAYSLRDLNFNAEIYIHKADNSQKPVNISMHPKYDINPIWSPDGKKLLFSSNRNNNDFDVWFVWLQKEDWERTKEDWEEWEPEKNVEKATDKKSKEPTKIEVTIDFDEIFERQVQVTSYTGGEFINAVSKDANTFYYTTRRGSRGNAKVASDLYAIKWNGKERKALTRNNKRPQRVIMDASGTYIYYTSFGGSVSRIKLPKGKPEAQPFLAKMKIDYKEESNQIFEEAWHAIKNGFYDPNAHGRDWNSLKAVYKPLAMKASTRIDFKQMFNWMLGQVNASHMGMRKGENRADLQKQKAGLLGVSVVPDTKSGLKITEVIANMPADRTSSKLQVGDIILGINGHMLTDIDNMYEHLTEASNQRIYLSVKSKQGEKREVIIRPNEKFKQANYDAWVKERRRLTDKYSNGKLGYLHIQGMNWKSFERFERELTAAGLGKEGIVIDVRYNGGGWTTDYLMSVLSVRQHAYTVPRGTVKDIAKEQRNYKNYYPFSERLPLASWTKPSIALCNENSYSNAEIFSHAYKSLGIGTLVGQPTFGAVISTGSTRLINGSTVRMPFRGWFVKSTEKNMELGPAVPDIMVSNAPDDKARGVDTQLKKAVDELLKQLENN